MPDKSATYEVRLKAMMDVSDVQSNVKAIQNALGKLKLPNNIDKGFKQNFDNVYKDIAKYQELLNKPVKTAADASQIEKLSSSISKQINNIRKDINSLNKEELHFKVDDKKLQQYIVSLTNVRKQIEEIATKNVNVTTFDKLLNKLKEADPASDKLRKTIEQLKNSLSQGDTEGITSGVAKLAELLPKLGNFKGDNFTQTFEKLGIHLGKDQQNLQGLINKLVEMSGKSKDAFGALPERAQKLQNNINNIHTDAFNNLVTTLTSADSAAKATGDAILAMGRSEAAATRETANMNKQFKDLQQSTQYFFSLRNMFNLLKRGIKDAFDVVKDLDKAMTDTAVVTNMTVSDLWKQLPDYTALANRLGATTQGAYETMTLYYQQGLNQQQAFALGEETIKMARIAGQDYAETTDMMTAALRGFNMELNETSAQRINDVYSNLAAKTASNTQEIGSAMERTASIAHSANMEFETTAAFLAQMIETTREAPENLGTAMKTIVARFQELKENPNEIVEVDGEEVDYNRVDKALKSIGVSLVDNQDKFRDLDDVFLDIASRWDSLTQMQQRYVATTAAGSRQQSRFIAMMNNYERTQELVSYATDSAGASNEQFNKTLDSLESKLNQLKNAWDQFLMGIANSDFIKGAVDILTDGLTKLNEIIDKLSGKSDFLQTLLSVGTGFVGLRFAGKMVNALTGRVGGLLDPQRTLVGRGGSDIQATGRSAQQAKQIYAPIVAAINNLKAVMQGQPEGGQFIGALDKQTFKQTQSNFRQQLANSIGTNNGVSTENIRNTFNGMSAQQQAQMLQSLPGFTNSLQKSFNASVKEMNLDKASQIAANKFGAALIKQAKRGEMSMDNALAIMSSKTKLAEAIGGQVGADIMKGAVTSWSQLDNAKLAAVYKNVKPNQLGTEAQMAAWARKSLNSQNGALKEVLEAELAKQYGSVDEFNKLMTGGVTYTGTQKIADGFGKIAGAATSAGMAIQNVGSALSMAGFDVAGSALMTIGSGITSIGMAASSATSVVTALAGAVGGFGPAGLILGTLAVTIGVATKAWIDQKKAIQEVKDAAEKVTSTYQDTTSEITKNLSTLQEYQDTFSQLSQGVDQNGNNVSLGTGEYEDYKKIVSELVAINPQLLQGYNAQGDAIIDNNKAIEESIKLLEEKKQAEIDSYISNSSGQKLAESLKVDEEFTKLFQSINGEFSGDLKKEFDNLADLFETSGFSMKDITKIVDTELDEFTIDSLKSLMTHSDELRNYLDKLDFSDELRKSIEDSLDKLDIDYGTILEKIQPQRDLLSTWFSQQEFDIEPTFLQSITSQFDQIVLQNYGSFTDQKQAITDAVKGYEELTKEGSYYSKLVAKVEKEQEKVFSKADVLDYRDEVKNALIALQNEADKAREAGEYLQAEFIENKIVEFAKYGVSSLEDVDAALNTLKDNIENARNAYENFQEKIKEGDYYTGAEDFKSIYDAIYNDKDNLGKGSQTYWAGLQGFLSSELWMKGDKDSIDSLMNNWIKPTLEEGEKGALAFFDFIRSKREQIIKETGEELIKFNKDGSFEFQIDNDEELEQLADSLGVSLQYLTAMLDKARQFYDIDFTNVDDLAKTLGGLETSKVLENYGSGPENGGLVNGTYTTFNQDQFVQQARMEGKTDEEIQELLATLKKEHNLLGISLETTGKTANLMMRRLGLSKDAESGTYSVTEFAENALGQGFDEAAIRDFIETNSKLFSDGALDIFDASIDEIVAKTETTEEEDSTDKYLEDIQGTVTSIDSKMPSDSSNPTEVKTSWETGELGQYGAGGILNTWFGSNNSGKLNSIQDKLLPIMNSPLLNGETGTIATENLGQLATTLRDAGTDVETNANVFAAYINASVSKIRDLDPEGQAQAIQDIATKLQGIGKDILSPEAKQQLLEGFSNLEINFNQEDITADVEKAVQAKEYSIGIIGNLTSINGISTGVSFGKLGKGAGYDSPSHSGTLFSDAQGQNNHRLGTFAQGSSGGYRIPGADTLTGEEGPELVWEPKQNRAYITGANGPQFANISKDAVVWTAAQTRAIQRNKGFVPFKSRGGGQEGKKGTGFSLGTGTLDVEGNVVKITQSEEFTIDVKANVIGGVNLPQNQSVNVQVQSQTVTPDVNTSGISSGIQSSIIAAGQSGAKGMSDAITNASRVAATNVRTNIYTAIVAAGNSAASSLSGITIRPNITPVLTRSKIIATGEKGSSATINLHWSAANGMNSGSVARGHGMLGPKGKGGLTLTGEEGYEVAWIPSENRSMILGANGPQMMDLPADTVVWNHKQSKDILKRGGLNIGSLAEGTIEAGSLSSVHGKIPADATGGGGSTPKTAKDKKRDKDTAETASNTKKIAASEDNRKRILDAISNKLDKLSNNVSDKLEKVGTTYSQVSSDIKSQVKLLIRSQKINQKVVDKNEKKLRKLDNKKDKVKIKDAGTVSNIGRFVYRDKESGAYQIDDKKLKKAYKGKKYEAVYNYLNEKINDYTSKRDEAQKNVDDAKAKLKDLTNEVRETFYDWENELTKLRNFSMKLELGESFQNKLQAYLDMINAKLLSGLGTIEEGAQAYTTTMQQMVASLTNSVNNSVQETAAAIEQYNKEATLSRYRDEKDRAKAAYRADKNDINKRAAWEKARDDYKAIQLAQKYISASTTAYGERTLTIDWKKYEADARSQGISSASNDAVQEYLDKQIENLQKIDESVTDTYNYVQKLYELRTEAIQTQADNAHTLISGMEAEAQEEIDKLNNINSTISNAFSELISKIRKELDRQRKLEQNEETERNISDQMNRLAMLRADTSGGNQVEIAQLERDIANARSDYEDSLEDQMLDRLQEQADEASKQREKQIKLLSAQLDQSKKTGEFIKKAEILVDAASVGKLTPAQIADFVKYYQLANGGDNRTKYDDLLNSGSAEQAISELAGTQQTIDSIDKSAEGLNKAVNTANILDRNNGLNYTSVKELWDQGISVKELKDLGASWSDIARAVKDLVTLKAGGMSAKDAKANGYTAQQMKNAKYSDKDILGAGWKGTKDAKDLAKVSENGKPAYSMKQIQKITGISAKQAYNISKANNRGAKDLAGISGKVDIDTNKKKKGIEKKDASATVGASGKTIASNVGSTLYVYDWSNGKQGELKAKYTIDEFNEKTLKNHPKEAKQALIYAIKHAKIGDPINKNFMDLAKSAGLIGQEYTTSDKNTVSVGGDGKLYYDSDDGIRVWNPGAGKTALYKKYDNKDKKIIAEFKKKAKAKGNINREFADVLKRYGITKFDSGGLASFTGPAWLDGTNSKPELVLNATDTKNFVALKDVLANAMKNGTFTDESAVTNFDININVDKIANDYDVDRMAERIKKIIISDARSRNVTTVGRLR